MKFLVLADIHSDYEKLGEILSEERGKFDAIIAPGDFTDMYEIPEGFTQLEMAEIVITKIIAAKKPVFAVPGNHDPYGIMETFKDYGINIHCEVRKTGNFDIMGWGGAMTPFDTRFEPTEEETDEYIKKTFKSIKSKNFILVVHNPPHDTALDMLQDKTHVGSKAIRRFIEDKKPVASVSAHIHESDGDDKIGDTVIFYPGAVFEGKYGIMEITKDKKVKCESKKL